MGLSKEPPLKGPLGTLGMGTNGVDAVGGRPLFVNPYGQAPNAVMPGLPKTACEDCGFSLLVCGCPCKCQCVCDESDILHPPSPMALGLPPKVHPGEGGGADPKFTAPPVAEAAPPPGLPPKTNLTPTVNPNSDTGLLGLPPMPSMIPT